MTMTIMTMTTRTAEEWGRAAVGLPDWRWMPGMLVHFGDWDRPCDHFRMGAGMRGMDTAVPMPGSEWWPDPDDPATAGCLLAMLGPGWTATSEQGRWVVMKLCFVTVVHEATLGRACIAAAEALGIWPGGTPCV